MEYLPLQGDDCTKTDKQATFHAAWIIPDRLD